MKRTSVRVYRNMGNLAYALLWLGKGLQPPWAAAPAINYTAESLSRAAQAAQRPLTAAHRGSLFGQLWILPPKAHNAQIPALRPLAASVRAGRRVQG